MGYTPHVLVVGGGATGTGVARDLAIRGLEVTLVERGPLAAGTSGSMHALLHSGARYADEDPETAAACRRENAVLRSIGDHLVRETGGLFASLQADPDDYLDTKRAACEAVDIPVDRLDGSEAREREASLAPETEAALAVPDAVVDPFALCVANAISARDHGARIATGRSIIGVERSAGAVDRVRLQNEDPTVEMTSMEKTEWLSPDYVVNATGPWVDEVADMADLSVPVRYSQGAMAVLERGGLEMVVNRCRPRGEGDIAVPFGGSAVLGTTDDEIDGPDDVSRTAADVDRLVDELRALVPGVASGRPFRAYWGVRALPPAEGEAPTVERSRTETLVDHEARDDCWGMTSVFGGKLTTHRATAERVADHVCAKFGIDRPCRTAELSLPAVPPATGSSESAPPTDPVLCEESGVRSSAVRAVVEDDVAGLGADLRPVVALTRAGMGPCQGGRCAPRLATAAAGSEYRAVDRALREFADARWAGRRHALWGGNAAAAMATYDFHVRTLDRRGLPLDTVEAADWPAYDDGRPAAGDEEDSVDV